VGVQPSELAKPALVIFLAFFVTWRARAINNARHTLVPAALAVGFLIFAWWCGPGNGRVLGLAAMAVFFVAGLHGDIASLWRQWLFWGWWFRFSRSLTA